jgi:Ca2+-binding EF-hand superfamily protein
MVSSVGGAAGYSAAAMQGAQCGSGSRGPQALQEKLFTKLDVNNDGGIDQNELGQFLDYVSSSTGSTSQTDTSQLFKTLDSDGDGTISKQELTDGAKKLFEELRAQLVGSKSGSTSDSTSATTATDETQDAKKQALFSKIDTNGDGSIDQSELGTFLSQKPEHHGHGGGGLFSKIDSLLDQYRSTAATTDSTDQETTSTLSAVA